jgi:tetratricopeptide (TPR) repeat protein
MNFSLKKTTQALLLSGFLCWGHYSFAQLNLPMAGGSKKASVSEWIGVTKVTIDYGRPAVNGREGKIWGELVPYGFTNLGYGFLTPAPWRAGANENTVIRFEHDVKIEGKDLKAGDYGFHIALAENGEATLIFSTTSTAWGSYFYRPEEDALRVVVKTEKTSTSQEYLSYEFINQTNNTATVQLRWEKLAIPFKVEVDVTKNVVAGLRKQLLGLSGAMNTWQVWNEAAQYCANNNTNLEEALKWADYSLSAPFVGEKHFSNLATKAQILEKLGKGTEAQVIMKDAINYGTAQEIHYYARSLQGQKKTKEAIEIFKLNAQKFPNEWVVNVGLARAYSAEGNFKKALEHANIAAKKAPDEQNKKNLEGLIKKLEAGQDIN